MTQAPEGQATPFMMIGNYILNTGHIVSVQLQAGGGMVEITTSATATIHAGTYPVTENHKFLLTGEEARAFLACLPVMDVVAALRAHEAALAAQAGDGTPS